jgi:arabinogalactan endo-1,4-beta-galactosidase
VPKLGAGTSGQKEHVVSSPLERKILDRKQTKIQEWSSAHHQRTVAETAYTFTLDWNDWTNNLVGLSYQELTINHRLLLGKSSFV